MAELPPYPEKVLSDYLREHDDLEAVGVRVVGKTPSDTSTPWVRLTQLNGDVHHAGRHGEFYCQFDCYAGKDGGQPEANLVARTVAAVLAALDRSNYTADDAVISGARVNMGPRLPDEDVDEPARERFIATATVWMHRA